VAQILGEGVRLHEGHRVAYNAAFFVVSHSRIFQYRTRKMVREAFENRFYVSDKQRKNMDKWPIGSQEGEDVTTEEERLDFYSDSDSDFW
jgi:hypothetical protein